MAEQSEGTNNAAIALQLAMVVAERDSLKEQVKQTERGRQQLLELSEDWRHEAKRLEIRFDDRKEWREGRAGALRQSAAAVTDILSPQPDEAR